MDGGGGQSDRINATRARVDHVANDCQWLWYMCYMLNVCACVQ